MMDNFIQESHDQSRGVYQKILIDHKDGEGVQNWSYDIWMTHNHVSLFCDNQTGVSVPLTKCQKVWRLNSRKKITLTVEISSNFSHNIYNIGKSALNVGNIYAFMQYEII